jgi:hypothetical protein
MRQLKFTAFVILLAFVAFNIAFADASIEERRAAKDAILAQESGGNYLDATLPETDDILQYCSSCYTNTTDDWITNVTFNTINNNTAGEGSPCSYGDYTGISTDVMMNQTYTLSVTFFSEGIWTEVVRAWIDWDQDEVFATDESFYLGEGVDATVTVDITIPVDAVPGPTRMRVIEQYSTDPGANGACDGQGNHTATYGETEDYTVNVMGAGDPGAMMGTVTDLQMLPIDGAIVTVSSFSDTTGSDGTYFFELFPLTYSATATAEYHNPVTIDDIVVVENETTIVDFALPTPLINVNTLVINLQVDSGEVITVPRNVANVGDGELEFNVEIAIGPITATIRRPGTGLGSMPETILRSREQLMDTRNEYSPTYTVGQLPTILDFGDEVFMFDPEGPTGDQRCLGIEFDGTSFWVTGAGDGSGSQNRIHKYDNAGNYIESFMQNTSSAWGWRDIAWDGEYLYASDDTQIDIFDPVSGTVVGSFNGPENPNRAMAYDPATDHFWTANFSSNIYEFDRNGVVINTYPNTQSLSIYGMAWDDASEDGPWLWIHSQDGTPGLTWSQFDPFTGTFTGLIFMGVDNGSGGIAGGAAFSTEWDPAFGIAFGLQQGTPDIVKGYEITPFSQWLTVAPMSGILQPAENIDLDVTIDFTGENLNYDSTYEAILYVHNNTASTPEIPVVINGIVDVEEGIEGLPKDYSLAQNFPNPFNARTSINFALPQQSEVTIEIFNLLGQKTATLTEGLLPAGTHTVTWAGVYYYRLSAGDYTAVKMMTLLK